MILSAQTIGLDVWVNYLLLFEMAQHGCRGVDTLLSAALHLADMMNFRLPDLFLCISYQPAQVFGLPVGTIRQGDKADIIVFDLETHWSVSEDKLMSQGKNNAFVGQTPSRDCAPHHQGRGARLPESN